MHSDDVQSKESPAESSTLRRIVAGARRHFFAHGLRGVTMDDLAESLGMSKKTLYAHFPGKTALVEAALLNKLQEIETELEQITSESSYDFLGKLHQLLACMQRHMDEIQPPFLRDLRREAEIFKLVEDRRRNVMQRHIGRLLEQGREAGIIRGDIPVELVMEILLGAVQAIINPAKMTELGLTPKAAFSIIITVIFEGVITEEGRSKL